MMSSLLDKYQKNEQDLWAWLVKYGYHNEGDSSKTPHYLKQTKQWEELFRIYGAVRDLRNDMVNAPDEIKEEVARQILAPHNINLDEIIDRHFS
jgi:hypothetical protein